MSKYAEAVDFTDTQENTARDAADKLRFIERQFKWRGDDWHFALAPHMAEAAHVYAWFKNAKKVGERVFFDASTPNGIMAYEWVKTRYIGQLLKAFGKIEIALAHNGQVVKRFNPQEIIKPRNLVMPVIPYME